MSEEKDLHLDQTEEDSSEEENVVAENDSSFDEASEVEEYKIGWQRALADYKNLQQEVEQKRSEWVKMSEVQVIESFLPVFDNFKKAFAHKPEGEENGWTQWADGIGFIMKQFNDILDQYGIIVIETEGKQFDPEKHEAISEEESEEIEEGNIIREVDTGYMRDDRILKVAKVIVSKGK